MYPPPSRPARPATAATAPADANGGANVYPEFRHLLSTQPTSTTTTISSSPNTTHPIPHRPATNPARQFQSVIPPTDAHALYPELRQRRPNALDQATAAVNAMLSEQLAATGADSTSDHRYSQLPPLRSDARPAALAPAPRAPAPAPSPRPLHRTNNFHVGMALVPNLGPLPTLMPFPELEIVAEDKKRGSTDSDAELAKLMAALSVDDDDNAGSESAQEESNTHGKQPSPLPSPPATPTPYISALEEEEEHLPPHAPMYKHALQLIRHQLHLPSLAHLPPAKIHACMLAARRNDRARNHRVRAIVAARAELTARMQRRALDWGGDGEVLDFMQEALAKLYYYDEEHWPGLEPLVYEEDEVRDWVVPARRCGMGLAGDWNPRFSFAEPFAPRWRGEGGVREEEEPVSPGVGRVRGAVARIEDGFGW